MNQELEGLKSAIDDVRRRIGIACTPEWVREQLRLIAGVQSQPDPAKVAAWLREVIQTAMLGAPEVPALEWFEAHARDLIAKWPEFALDRGEQKGVSDERRASVEIDRGHYRSIVSRQ